MVQDMGGARLAAVYNSSLAFPPKLPVSDRIFPEGVPPGGAELLVVESRVML
jgi:hypothetical protein